MKNNQNLVSMKNILIALVMVLAMGMILPATAQTTEKEAGKALNKKSMKKARKEAKKYKKKGFYVPPGALPMDIQLENAWKKQMLLLQMKEAFFVMLLL